MATTALLRLRPAASATATALASSSPSHLSLRSFRSAAASEFARRPPISAMAATTTAATTTAATTTNAPSATAALLGAPALPLSSSLRPAPTVARGLSTAPATEKDPNVLEWPKNLKLDSRSSASPFYGLKKVEGAASAVEVEDDEGDEAEIEGERDEYEENDDDYEEDDEDEIDLYDLTTRPQPYRSVPLPDRLHVPVVRLFTGEEVGHVHLDPSVFGCDPIRVDLIHRVYVYQRNKFRGKRNAGAVTKTISQVSGSGRKVRPQKGQGKARAGHSRPPHWRGGAKAHGPKGNVQDYTTKLNKKVRRAGLRHALSQKLLEGNLMVTSDLSAESHKTGALAKALDRYDIGGRYGTTAFMVDDAGNEELTEGSLGGEDEAGSLAVGGVDVNFKVASGNIKKIRLTNHLGCGVWEILKHERLVLSLAAVRTLEERLKL